MKKPILFEVLKYEEEMGEACHKAALKCEHFKVGEEAIDKRDYRWHYCFHPTRTDKYRLAHCIFTSEGICAVTKHAYGLPPDFHDLQTELMREGKS